MNTSLNNTQQQDQTKYILSQISSYIDDEKDKTLLKVLFIVPESAGDIFLSTSLLSSLKEMYSPCKIYFACYPQFFDILKNNPYVHRCIPYHPIMDNQVVMEGSGEWVGLFDISIMSTILTQRVANYLNNGMGKIAFNIKKK